MEVDFAFELNDGVIAHDGAEWDEPKVRSHYIQTDPPWYPGSPEPTAWQMPRHCDGTPRRPSASASVR